MEIRGRLTEEGYKRLKEYLLLHGQYKGVQKREMYLLRGYPGYSEDPTVREVDIRLRNTDGHCEIMLKTKASEGNTGRHEISLPLSDHGLERAKQIARAFGCTSALKMVREKEVYELDGVEWSLLNCPPKNIRFFETEQEAESDADISQVKEALVAHARKLGADPLVTDEQMREFIYMLDREVNEEVVL